jgi:hypothetical protein
MNRTKLLKFQLTFTINGRFKQTREHKIACVKNFSSIDSFLIANATFLQDHYTTYYLYIEVKVRNNVCVDHNLKWIMNIIFYDTHKSLRRGANNVMYYVCKNTPQSCFITDNMMDSFDNLYFVNLYFKSKCSVKVSADKNYHQFKQSVKTDPLSRKNISFLTRDFMVA